jgi:hypothetical protein
MFCTAFQRVTRPQPLGGTVPEDSMQLLFVVAAVLISLAAALASAEAILSLLFRFMSRMR